MRVNAARYARVFFAARCVVALLSVGLGLLVWAFARQLYGARGALLALSFYAFAPEAIAHAGVATMDLATGLAFLASVFLFWRFARTGRRGAWAWTALAVGLALLTRFTAVLLAPLLVVLAAAYALTGRVRHPGRLWLGLALLLPAALVILDLGYLGRTSFEPIGRWHFVSRSFQSLQHAAPWLRLPLPNTWVGGIDRQAVESQSGATPTYVLGRIHSEPVRWYFPFAMLIKWPLGFLLALLARGMSFIPGWGRHRWRHELFLLVPVAVLLGAGALANLNIGIRYMFPVLPFLCVWLGGLGATRRRRRAPSAARPPIVSGGIPPARARRALGPVLGVALAFAQAAESTAAAPWELSFFNLAAGGPGGGDRLINDSNVDWGQGLIALREELARRGIRRVHLAYHGTADPAVYGIDYVPFLGGTPGPESDWMAVSSYYFVGLPQRMMTPRGPTPQSVRFDMRALWARTPAARPARCMYLFKIR